MTDQTRFSWGVGAVGGGVALLLCFLALPRLIEGIGIQENRALEIRTILEERAPISDYQSAARRLAGTLSSDGDGLVRQAEMQAMGAGSDAAELKSARNLVIAGLQRAPLNPRGWTLLCELDAGTAQAVSHCMETGFFIAPFDWFTARRRALLVGYLLPQLSPAVQSAAARRVRQMWDQKQWSDFRNRFAIFDIYNTPHGAELLQAGFRDDKDELRLLNQWLLHQRINALPKK